MPIVKEEKRKELTVFQKEANVTILQALMGNQAIVGKIEKGMKPNDFIKYLGDACQFISEVDTLPTSVTCTNDEEYFKDILNILDDGSVLTSQCQNIFSFRYAEENTVALKRGKVVSSRLVGQEFHMENIGYNKLNELPFILFNSIRHPDGTISKMMEIVFYMRDRDEKYNLSLKVIE